MSTTSAGADHRTDGWLRRVRRRVSRTLAPAPGPTVPEFAARAPSAQQLVDVFAGQWITAFPDDLGLSAGWVNHFDPAVDQRVPWADSVIDGGISGLNVLELGPFEGYHTATFESLGAASVTSVEGSRTAFLKCLVVKELLGLHARVLYGDVNAFLAGNTTRYDLVWASGILYHQADPVGFLERAASAGDRLFLHTHYFDAAQAGTMATADRFRPDLDEVVEWHGRRIHGHRYEYATDTALGTFAGGPRPYALWLERPDIEFILRELGFATIEYGVVDPGNPSGPGCYLLATRG